MTPPLNLVLVWLGVLVATTSVSIGVETGKPFPEGERIFRQNPDWLGADAALSVPLSKGRVLWLFGDTFIARTPARRRSESTMVRNSIAIQTGDDPRKATLLFSWRKGPDGGPASFFPERGGQWYWPGHGIRLPGGPLVLFLNALISTKENSLGFTGAGYAVAVIDNPDDPAEDWKLRFIRVRQNPFDMTPGAAVLREGHYVFALAVRGKGSHGGTLVRYPLASLGKGDLTSAHWWAGSRKGWQPASDLGPEGPQLIMDDAGAECSLHWSEQNRTFVHVASYGFGASGIGIRTASRLTGPWSAPRMVYRPPESNAPQPFVYAAKAHPELTGPRSTDLVVTYVANSFRPEDLFSRAGAKGLYWPRVVVVPGAR